jgi:hypothetical protein
MNTVAIGAASAPSSTTILCAAGGIARIRQCVDFTEAMCAATVRHLHRAVSRRKEALILRMQEFVLELLAAIVLIAIFVIATDPATRGDC